MISDFEYRYENDLDLDYECAIEAMHWIDSLKK